jgi:hypothetical protein
MLLSSIGENLALLNNGGNGDSVPATVPGSELVRLMRQQLNLEPLPCRQTAGNRCATRRSPRSRPTVRVEVTKEKAEHWTR